jgi:hypothetical protein
LTPPDIGIPCDADGNFLHPGGEPPRPGRQDPAPDDWSPFNDQVDFEMADLVYRRCQLSAESIDEIMALWAASLLKHRDVPPFHNHREMHRKIDSILLGDVPWQCFSTRYAGDRPAEGAPSWMDADYEVWFRDPHTIICNMLENSSFDGEMEYSPFKQFDSDGQREFKDFMSGDWVWEQAVSCLLIHKPVA